MALQREPHPIRSRIERILSADYPICRDDVVWMLEYIKKKVADEAPELLSLPQPRLLRIFQNFAEVSMMMLKHRNGCIGPEADRLRGCLSEAIFVLPAESD
jgi:hypothetical protein